MDPTQSAAHGVGASDAVSTGYQFVHFDTHTPVYNNATAGEIQYQIQNPLMYSEVPAQAGHVIEATPQQVVYDASPLQLASLIQQHQIQLQPQVLLQQDVDTPTALILHQARDETGNVFLINDDGNVQLDDQSPKFQLIMIPQAEAQVDNMGCSLVPVQNMPVVQPVPEQQIVDITQDSLPSDITQLIQQNPISHSPQTIPQASQVSQQLVQVFPQVSQSPGTLLRTPTPKKLGPVTPKTQGLRRAVSVLAQRSASPRTPKTPTPKTLSHSMHSSPKTPVSSSFISQSTVDQPSVQAQGYSLHIQDVPNFSSREQANALSGKKTTYGTAAQILQKQSMSPQATQKIYTRTVDAAVPQQVAISKGHADVVLSFTNEGGQQTKRLTLSEYKQRNQMLTGGTAGTTASAPQYIQLQQNMLLSSPVELQNSSAGSVQDLLLNASVCSPSPVRNTPRGGRGRGRRNNQRSSNAHVSDSLLPVTLANSSPGTASILYVVKDDNTDSQTEVSSTTPSIPNGICKTEGTVVTTEDQSILSTNSTSTTPMSTTTSTSKSVLPCAVIESPKIVPGYLALCPNCGFLSSCFRRCQRCRRVIPANCKSIKRDDYVPEAPKSPSVIQPIPESKFYGQNSMTSTLQKQMPELRNPRLRRPKQPSEPVCLTISSDEDEENTKHNQSQNTSLNDQTVNELQNLNVSNNVPNELKDPKDYVTSLKQGMLSGPYTTIKCRSIRVGSHKVMHVDMVTFCNYGICMSIPSVESDSDYVEIFIEYKDVTQVLAFYGRSMPVLFFVTNMHAAERIQKLLKMNCHSGPYYNPESTDEIQKRVTFLPDTLKEEGKLVLQKLLSPLNVMPLDGFHANELLVRSSPKDVGNTRCTRSQTVGPPPEVQRLLLWPPAPAKGGISINTEDFSCLAEEQFLNDAIIDFYLLYLLLSKLSAADRDRTHIFSTFFYNRLTSRKGEPPQTRKGRTNNGQNSDVKRAAAIKRHSRVKNWTKNVDLFSKDFIIVPINEHNHWFLAIICFPGLTGCQRMSDNSPVETPKIPPKVPKGPVKILRIGSTIVTAIPDAQKPLPHVVVHDEDDRDEADGDDDEMESNHDDVENEIPAEDSSHIEAAATQKEKTPTETEPKNQSSGIKQPCILVFDSLAGDNHSRVVATLRDYLTVEYSLRKKGEKEFTKDTMRGHNPKVPQQNNFSDCGLYVLQYVESFFSAPLKDFKLPIKSIQNWFPEEVVQKKRKELYDLIQRLMVEQNLPVDNVPKLHFSDPAKPNENETEAASETTDTNKNMSSTNESDIPEDGAGFPDQTSESTENSSHDMSAVNVGGDKTDSTPASSSRWMLPAGFSQLKRIAREVEKQQLVKRSRTETS